jgi:hypothetical protein
VTLPVIAKIGSGGGIIGPKALRAVARIDAGRPRRNLHAAVGIIIRGIVIAVVVIIVRSGSVSVAAA